ncbi:MAG: trigger factor [Mucinivorans sp.]
MNVTRENLEDQTTLLKITLTEADYKETVDKALKNIKKKANVPGFRPGMVPMGLIQKMYGKSTLAEQTYHMATDAAFDKIKEDNIDPLGDLMPAQVQEPLDFENNKEFEFIFEIGIAPEVKIDLSDKDVVEKTVVVPDAEMVEGYKNNFLHRFGKLVEVEQATSEEALTVNLDNQEMQIEDAYVGLISMSEQERAPFIGKKVGDKMSVNINELYKDAKQRAAILSLKESELEGVNPQFELEITKIRAFQNPELNEEFFATAFPDGEVKDQQAFNAKIEVQVAQEIASQTAFKFDDDIRDYVVKKCALPLPEEFLKRWLFQANEGKFSAEDIEKEFPQFSTMMQWDLIKRAVAKENNIEVTKEDAMAEAKEMANAQFRYYGMASAADDMLENYANQILSNKEESNKIYDKVGQKKVTAALAAKMGVKEKKMSVAEFSQMMQKK